MGQFGTCDNFTTRVLEGAPLCYDCVPFPPREEGAVVLRPAVRWFAEAMEKKLRDWDSWNGVRGYDVAENKDMYFRRARELLEGAECLGPFGADRAITAYRTLYFFSSCSQAIARVC